MANGVTFDDIPDSVSITDKYTDLQDVRGRVYQDPDNAVSGVSLFSGFGQAEFTFVAPVVFNSVYYNANGNNEGHSYTLYLGDTMVFEGQAWQQGNSDHLDLIQSQYSGQVSRIVFAGSRDGVHLDNLSFTTAVPEPETYGMMLGGLGLLGFMARRKAARAA